MRLMVLFLTLAAATPVAAELKPLARFEVINYECAQSDDTHIQCGVLRMEDGHHLLVKVDTTTGKADPERTQYLMQMRANQFRQLGGKWMRVLSQDDDGNATTRRCHYTRQGLLSCSAWGAPNDADYRIFWHRL